MGTPCMGVGFGAFRVGFRSRSVAWTPTARGFLGVKRGGVGAARGSRQALRVDRKASGVRSGCGALRFGTGRVCLRVAGVGRVSKHVVARSPGVVCQRRRVPRRWSAVSRCTPRRGAARAGGVGLLAPGVDYRSVPWLEARAACDSPLGAWEASQHHVCPATHRVPCNRPSKEVFLARPKCQTTTLISSSRRQLSAGRLAKSDVARTMSFRERKKSRPPRRKSDVDGENSICDVKKSCAGDANYRSSRQKSAWSAANCFLLWPNQGQDSHKSAP